MDSDEPGDLSDEFDDEHCLKQLMQRILLDTNSSEIRPKLKGARQLALGTGCPRTARPRVSEGELSHVRGRAVSDLQWMTQNDRHLSLPPSYVSHIISIKRKFS